MHALLGIMVLAFSLSCFAQSNPPAETPSVGTGQQQQQAGHPNPNSKADERGTKSSPFVIQSIPVLKTEHQTYIESQHEETKAMNEAFVAYSTVALAVITLFLVVVTGILARYTYRLWEETKTLAIDAKNASDRQFNSQVAAERGYVKVLHLTPGVRIQEGEKSFLVDFEIKNWGRTPVHVTDVRFGHKALEYGERFPTPFPFKDGLRESFPNSFLVPGESMFVRNKSFTLMGEKGTSVISGGLQLWVFAHVYYTDVFEKRWVGGYVRKYVRIIDDGLKNNLEMDTEAIYDFDRAYDEKKKKADV